MSSTPRWSWRAGTTRWRAVSMPSLCQATSPVGQRQEGGHGTDEERRCGAPPPDRPPSHQPGHEQHDRRPLRQQAVDERRPCGWSSGS